jgi:hypothetical protein
LSVLIGPARDSAWVPIHRTGGRAFEITAI